MWIHSDFPWLSCSPDGLTIQNDQIIPVEIKCSNQNKSARKLILEYYGQFQTQMEIVGAKHLLLILVEWEKLAIRAFSVSKDIEFVSKIIKIAEQKYFDAIPKLFLPKAPQSALKELKKLSEFLNKYPVLNESDAELRNRILHKPIKTPDFAEVSIFENIFWPRKNEKSTNFLARAYDCSKSTFGFSNSDSFSILSSNYFVMDVQKSEDLLRQLETCFRTLAGRK